MSSEGPYRWVLGPVCRKGTDGSVIPTRSIACTKAQNYQRRKFPLPKVIFRNSVRVILVH